MGRQGREIQGFRVAPAYTFFSLGLVTSLVARGTTSGLAGSVGLALEPSLSLHGRYTISARVYASVPIKTKKPQGKEAAFPTDQPPEMITPTDTTAASTSAQNE